MTILLGDCLDHMKKMEDNSIDFIVTDPPYGIAFMGKNWDRGIPSTQYWQEMLRVCKPGSMMLCAGLPRMIHRLGCIVEDSGWEIRDMIMHLFGSGFPKSHNKFGLPGYGTALKPAWEGWILAMKPLDGTFAKNAEKRGIAGLNIDESRIGIGGTKRSHQAEYPKNEDGTEDRSKHLARTGHSVESNGMGRWPANLILSEEAAEELDQMTQKQIHLSGRSTAGDHSKSMFSGLGKNDYGKRVDYEDNKTGASRFFYCPKASSAERNKGLEEMPVKENRPLGISNWDGQTNGSGKVMGKSSPQANNHPTVKPIALMKYLLKLLAPPGNPIILDPFAGSGSTLVAAKELGIRFIGIEKEPEYHAIAEARIKAAKIYEEQLEIKF